MKQLLTAGWCTVGYGWHPLVRLFVAEYLSVGKSCPCSLLTSCWKAMACYLYSNAFSMHSLYERDYLNQKHEFFSRRASLSLCGMWLLHPSEHHYSFGVVRRQMQCHSTQGVNFNFLSSVCWIPKPCWTEIATPLHFLLAMLFRYWSKSAFAFNILPKEPTCYLWDSNLFYQKKKKISSFFVFSCFDLNIFFLEI